MKICVLGAGALGCAIGGVLSEGGSDVWLINRSQAHVAAMREHGLRLRDANGERVARVQAATNCEGIGPADLVIVLVKSFHTREAIEGARAIVGPHTVVLSLQNGLGHEDILAEVVGRERVMAGKTYVGGVMLAPGLVSAGTAGKETLIGELDGSISARSRAIQAEFERAGLLHALLYVGVIAPSINGLSHWRGAQNFAQSLGLVYLSVPAVRRSLDTILLVMHTKNIPSKA